MKTLTAQLTEKDAIMAQLKSIIVDLESDLQDLAGSKPAAFCVQPNSLYAETKSRSGSIGGACQET
jgi:hypothetical protein